MRAFLVHLVVHLVALTATVLVSARFIRGVRVKSVPGAIAAAAVFSGLSFGVGWLLRLLLAVPTALTFGLLSIFVPLLVNAALLWGTDRLLKAFEIERARALWLMALLTTVVMGVVRFALG